MSSSDLPSPGEASSGTLDPDLGAAWLEALVERAGIDQRRLERGPSYADRSRLSELVVQPGVLSAEIAQSRRITYSPVVEIRCLDADEWATVEDALAADARLMASAVDGELRPDLLALLADNGVDLLPGVGDVTAECTCPDADMPCKHAAGLLHWAGEELSVDGALLLHLRGRPLADVVRNAARRRKGGVATTGTPIDRALRLRHPRTEPSPPTPIRGEWEGPPEKSRRGVPPPEDELPVFALETSPLPQEMSATQAGLRLLATDGVARARALLSALGETGSADTE